MLKKKSDISVLLVDDERVFLKVMSKRLALKGFKPGTALCGEDAVSMVKEKHFDVIVLDIAMPGIDGIQTLRKIKEEDKDSQVIMMTGYATVERSVEAMKEGAIDFLEKPVDAEVLINKILKAHEASEKRRQEVHMSHTEKLASIGTLAAGVAHELNNPLTIILGMTDLMLEEMTPDSKHYENLKAIERQGTNAKRIVENLLRFARYTEYTEEDININQSLDEVLTIVRKTLAFNNIDIVCEMNKSLPIVRGIPGELQQVFLNIITNAIYEMKGGGNLTIGTKSIEDGQKVEVWIADTGPGIKRKNQERIFDPFFTTKTVGEGTGLGLSVSYGLVAKHGGDITFDTKTKDESLVTGTEFIITLPSIAQINEEDKYAK
ncbi:hybrid sensor histidine kinase/response regulator [Candidatus Magnetomonas plexicatena]|uniref:hybrid sensor histidine kinase/response regulator n=1 Tax=Candidatus Magnetomonas plexicatena TaxID=2552947 RepID=UPI001C775F17|nr:response regulator [Nitrospirales bacterium LBB_01]